MGNEQDDEDQKEKADTAAAIVAETWAKAESAKTEDKEQNDQKNQHKETPMAANSEICEDDAREIAVVPACD